MFRLKRLFKSFTYSFRGIKKAFLEEDNLQIQLVVGIIIIIIAFILKIKPLEWCLVILVVFLVILMEMINSAVERAVDILKPRIHTYAKEIKDIMAAAVMLSGLLAIIVGLIIFTPYIIEFLNF